jgi:KipI family sensor histidine kinase inhibitor
VNGLNRCGDGGRQALPRSRIRTRPVGEGARLIELGEPKPETTALARALAARILSEEWPGVYDVLPAYRTVLVRFDPCHTDGPSVDARVRATLAIIGPISLEHGRVVELAVRYGGEYGPDLADVAAHTGLLPEEVARQHAAASYRVEFLGFSPGFPFLSGLPPALATPRLDTPRERVPAGSVGIAGMQTGFYPLSSPGGWRLIGRIVGLDFDPARPETLPYGPGDTIRFVAVAHDRDVVRMDGPLEERAPAPNTRISSARPAGGSPQAIGPDAVGEAGSADLQERSPVGEEASGRVSQSPAGARALLVRRSGPHTSVQDLGRAGLARMGYAPAGALDRAALRTANALVGNAPDAAGLEIALAGAEFEAVGDLIIAVAGADLTPLLDGEPLPFYRAAAMRGGMRLRFAAAQSGLRSYLAVGGGIATPEVLGSRSTDLIPGIGGLEGRLLRAGDRVPVGELEAYGPGYALTPPRPSAPTRISPRVIWGPEDNWFSEETRRAFVESTYRVSQRGDRTGVRLEGEPLRPATARSLASEGAAPGAIQIPPDGQPIVLLADSRGVGGYPKIAVVIEADLDSFAQAAPGTPVRFMPVSEEDGRQATRAYREALMTRSLAPAPELAVRCLREADPARPPAVPCPRSLGCLLSGRCSVLSLVPARE